MPYINGPSSAASGGTGTQLDYVQITADVPITATTDATATTVITGNAVTYSGSQRIQIACGGTGYTVAAANEIIVVLYDGASAIGRLTDASNQAGSSVDLPAGYGARFLTPTVGSHTYSIRAFRVSGASAVTYLAGLGGSGVSMPAWYRITTA